MKMITTVIVFGLGVGVGAYIIYKKTHESPSVKSDKDESADADKSGIQRVTNLTLRDDEKSNDFFYLSYFNDLLRNFDLDPLNYRSFQILRKKISMSCGKDFLQSIENILNTSDNKAVEITETYEKFKEANALDIKTNVEHKSSPKITVEGLALGLKKYGLMDLANQNLRETAVRLLKADYLSGKDRVLVNYAKSVKYLKENLQEHNKSNIDKELELLKGRINHDLRMLKLSES